MLKKMGNQNATAVIEEEKAADEAARDSSDESATEENETKDEQMIGDDDLVEDQDQDQDQPLDHVKGDHGVNSKEPISNETRGIEDDDVEDQGIEDATLDSISNARVSHESDDLATSDDDVLDKLNQEDGMSIGTSRSIDTEEEIGHPIAAKMSETEEEKVIDEVEISEQKSIDFVEVNDPNVSHNQEVLLHSESLHVASSEASSTDDEAIGLTRETQGISDQEIGGAEMEVEKTMMDTSLHAERYDHDTNNKDLEEFFEVVAKSDDVADFKDFEIVDTKANPECSLAYETSQLERHGEDTNNFKDLEIVELPTEFRPPRSKTSSIDLARAETSNDHRCVIDKSPSFEFTNLVTKPEDSDQTPLLYHTNKAPMRSLSTPVIARFIAPLDGPAEERTINTVDYDQKPPRTPLNGFLKDQTEETHLLKPQKIHQEAENRHEMIMVEPQGSRERRNKGRISGSYFFSSCICCARVEQLADP